MIDFREIYKIQSEVKVLKETMPTKLDKAGGIITKDLQINNYLKLNAWPSYGSGTINIWADKNGSGTLDIDGASDLRLDSHLVYHVGRKPTWSDVGAIQAGNWRTNGGQDLLVHNKRALVGLENGTLHLSYGDDFTNVMVNNYKVFHEGHKPQWSEIEGKPATFAPGAHSHDDRYFTETEANSRFALTSHTHTYDKFGISNTDSTTKKGISLYGGASSAQPEYGLMFSGTAGSGTHGAVTGDWATYFTMAGATTRGWIFKQGTNNVASISGTGVITGADVKVGSHLVYHAGRKPHWNDIQGKPDISSGAHSHDDRYFTESEINTKLSEKAKRVYLNGQCQTASYRKSVIALCKLAGTNISHDSFSIGTISFHRTNGLSGGIQAQVSIEDQYSGDMVVNASITHNAFGGYIKGCTFKYNNIWYGGIEFYFSDAELSHIEFIGNSNFGIFAKDYDDTRSGEPVVNQEIKDSLNTTTKVNYTGHFKFNDRSVFHEGHKPTWSEVDGKPTSFTPATHTHDDRYYTESEMNTKLSAKLGNAGGTLTGAVSSNSIIKHIKGGAGSVIANGTSRTMTFASTTLGDHLFGGNNVSNDNEISEYIRIGVNKLQYTTGGSSYDIFHTGHKPTWSEVDGKPTSFTPASHTHDDRYYTESEINSKLDGETKNAKHLGTSNLNDIKTPGHYYQDANVNTSTERNYPTLNAGALQVYKAAGIIQVYRRYHTGESYQRSFYSNTWTGWIKKAYYGMDSMKVEAHFEGGGLRIPHTTGEKYVYYNYNNAGKGWGMYFNNNGVGWYDWHSNRTVLQYSISENKLITWRPLRAAGGIVNSYSNFKAYVEVVDNDDKVIMKRNYDYNLDNFNVATSKSGDFIIDNSEVNIKAFNNMRVNPKVGYNTDTKENTDGKIIETDLTKLLMSLVCEVKELKNKIKILEAVK